MSVRLQCAGAQRQTHPIPDAAQAWEVAAHGAGTVVGLAEAGEFAFELPRFNELSRAVAGALVSPEGADAWVRAAARLRARRAELGDDWEVSVYASAVRLHAVADEVRISWLGGTQACLYRAGVLLDRTRPHTLGEERRRRGLPAAPQAGRTDFILMRCLSPEEDAAPEEGTWPVQPGDRILVLSSLLANRRSDARVRRAAQLPHPEAAAADLLGLDEAGDPPVGLAVVVVDVEAT